MWAFVDANPTTDAQRFRNVGFPRLVVHDNAFLAVTNWWTIVKTFVVAFLRLTIVFFQNSNPHVLTSNLPELHHQ